MFASFFRELEYLINHKWDLSLVTLAPLVIILLFSSMFYQGKPEHLPIAVVDQDRSELSRQIKKYLTHQSTLHIELVTQNLSDAERKLNQNKIWGYVVIPAGAEQRLVHAEDAQIGIFFNQSYFSVGNSISSAMFVSSLEGIQDYMRHHYLVRHLPELELPTATVKISPLYNPDLNYELYLEPYMIPAILHLLLCCCVAFSVGQELKFKTTATWVMGGSAWRALITKNLTYVFIFSFWTWVWMFWLIEVRGWFVVGQLWVIIFAQFLLYCAYAFISSAMVLATQNLSKTFGLIAVYGGSSLSFAGVTLPLNNAPLFTKIWANIIPYTPYAKLQTQQWIVGSPLATSVLPFFILILYAVLYFILALFLLKHRLKAGKNETIF
ncbi:ABC transporter permease [Acinetobacter towneri]|uniref:ABC transporter permease n=1 Tax=Acinetobacter towneri TaxID=202956 RepID=UPI0025759257|nr:ABC transporter permease [Acinetobacter towneri]MDM1755434.1 ABC transporter permease [Acinetobacter towneri]